MRFKQLLILAAALMIIASMIVPAAAQDTKAVTVAWPQELDNLNPMYSTMSFVGYTQDLYLHGAWNLDNELNPNPVLVTEMPSLENGGVSEDGTILTLNLRDDATWHDGEPVTSADFLFTYEMVMSDANTPVTRYPYEDFVATVEAPDDTTVVVTFTGPFASWATTLFTWILPEHVLRPVFDEAGTLDGAEWNTASTVANGPFVFAEWERGSFMRFTKNENYFMGAPNLDVVVVQFIPDSVAYVLALSNEDADIGTFFDYPDIASLEESGANVVQILPSGYNEAWFYNVNPETAHPAMLDVNVRKALALGFDRFQITRDLLLDRTYPAGSFWENSPYANPDIDAPPYDPEMAAQLLDEAGWVDSDGDGIRDKDGEFLSLRYITNQRQIRADVQVVAQQQLGELGVELLLENYPSDIYFNGYLDGGPQALGEYDIAEFSTNPAGFPDPDTARFLCAGIVSEDNPSGENWQGYCNPALDELFAEQAVTADAAARVELFHQIDQILYDDFIWVSVWHDPDLWMYNTRIQNINMNAKIPFWNIYSWDV